MKPLPAELRIMGGVRLHDSLHLDDALDYCRTVFPGIRIRFVWTEHGEEDGMGGKEDEDLPGDMTVEDFRHHAANDYAKLVISEGGREAEVRSPELVSS